VDVSPHTHTHTQKASWYLVVGWNLYAGNQQIRLCTMSVRHISDSLYPHSWLTLFSLSHLSVSPFKHNHPSSVTIHQFVYVWWKWISEMTIASHQLVDLVVPVYLQTQAAIHQPVMTNYKGILQGLRTNLIIIFFSHGTHRDWTP